MSELRKKSIHDLRQIAQSFSIADIFSKDQLQLCQAIELKQQDMSKRREPPEIPKPEYDARLMTKPPAKMSHEESIKELLKEHVVRGLRLTFPDPERWEMSYGKKTDCGNMRMPLRVVLGCADRLLK